MAGEIIQVHPSERVRTPDGDFVEIDTGMVPLVRRLWELGFATAGACIDLGQSIMANGHLHPEGHDRSRHGEFYAGQAWLRMPLEDATELVALLGRHPVFGARLRRWTHPDAWMPIAWLNPTEDGGAGLHPTAQLHFPNRQLSELQSALSMA